MAGEFKSIIEKIAKERKLKEEKPSIQKIIWESVSKKREPLSKFARYAERGARELPENVKFLAGYAGAKPGGIGEKVAVTGAKIVRPLAKLEASALPERLGTILPWLVATLGYKPTRALATAPFTYDIAKPLKAGVGVARKGIPIVKEGLKAAGKDVSQLRKIIAEKYFKKIPEHIVEKRRFKFPTGD